MKSIFEIFKKELKTLLSSPLAFALIGVFALYSGVVFYNLVVNFIHNIQIAGMQHNHQLSFMDEVVVRFFGNINFFFLFFIPLLTMRSFSEEVKKETIDQLFLSPISDISIVVGKLLGVFAIVTLCLLLTGFYPLVIIQAGLHDLSLVWSGYLALWLNALSYISLGLFFSSLTHYSVLAGLFSIMGIILFWIFAWVGQMSTNFLLGEIFHYLSITSHFERVLKGLVGTQDLIYYFSFLFLFSWLTSLGLKRRHW